VGIGAERVEGLVIEAVFEHLQNRRLSAAVSRRGARSGRASGTSVERIQHRLDGLAEMFASGEVTKAEWATARASLIRRLDDAHKAEAAELRDASAVAYLAHPDVLRSEWPQMDLGRQRMILSVLIDHITIAPTCRGNNKFLPERLDIAWKV
jgi:hypothetical protein